MQQKVVHSCVSSTLPPFFISRLIIIMSTVQLPLSGETCRPKSLKVRQTSLVMAAMKHPLVKLDGMYLRNLPDSGLSSSTSSMVSGRSGGDTRYGILVCCTVEPRISHRSSHSL